MIAGAEQHWPWREWANCARVLGQQLLPLLLLLLFLLSPSPVMILFLNSNDSVLVCRPSGLFSRRCD